VNTPLQITSLLAALGVGIAVGEHRAATPAAAPLQEQEQAAPEAAPEMDPMLVAWMQAGTPGEHHRHMDAFVGTWDTEVSLWMDPTRPPDVTEGTMETRWILDGRYLENVYDGEAMGMPFAGRGILAYDNAAQTYRGVWIDSMSTHLQESAGYVNEDGTRWTMRTSATDPMTGEPIEGKEEIVVEGPDRHVMTAWMKQGDAWVKTMQIVYTRAG
jgi:hypothetical protein